jgi:hypothetical protein
MLNNLCHVELLWFNLEKADIIRVDHVKRSYSGKMKNYEEKQKENSKQYYGRVGDHTVKDIQNVKEKECKTLELYVKTNVEIMHVLWLVKQLSDNLYLEQETFVHD